MAETADRILEYQKNILEALEHLESSLVLNGSAIQVVDGLSDISERLGLVRAGEFRTGNNKEIGSGFSGIRMGYPGFYYPSTSINSSDYYNFVGVDADTMQFGLRSSDGIGVFGGGIAELSAGGAKITDSGGAPAFHVFTGPDTIDSEIFAAGDVLIGDNASGKPNILWDQSAGDLYFRHGQTITGRLAGSQGGLSLASAKIQMTSDDALGTLDLAEQRVPFSNLVYDDGGFWSSDAPYRLTIPAGQTGTYGVGFHVMTVINGDTGLYQYRFSALANWGSPSSDFPNWYAVARTFPTITRTIDSDGGGANVINCYGEMPLSSGDYIELWCQLAQAPTSGAADTAVNFVQNSPFEMPELYLRRVR